MVVLAHHTAAKSKNARYTLFGGSEVRTRDVSTPNRTPGYSDTCMRLARGALGRTPGYLAAVEAEMRPDADAMQKSWDGLFAKRRDPNVRGVDVIEFYTGLWRVVGVREGFCTDRGGRSHHFRRFGVGCGSSHHFCTASGFGVGCGATVRWAYSDLSDDVSVYHGSYRAHKDTRRRYRRSPRRRK